MKFLFFLSIPLLSIASIVPSEFKVLDSNISEVTVFSDRALITRKVTQINSSWIKIEALPNNLDKNSLKIKAIGADSKSIKQIIIGDSFYQNTLPSDIDKKVEKLKDLYLEKLSLEQEHYLLNYESNFINTLGFESPYQKTTNNYLIFEAQTKTVAAAINQISNVSLNTYQEIQKVDDKIKSINDEIRVLKTNLSSHDERRSQKWLTDIYINVDNKNFKKNSYIEISYYIMNSHWLAQYDVRCQMDLKNGKVNIDLVSFGKIENKTGEDWDDVKITLSSIDPTPLYLPQLNRWLFSEKREEVQEPNESFLGNLASSAMDSMSAPSQDRAAGLMKAKRVAKKRSKGARMEVAEAKAIAQAPMADSFGGIPAPGRGGFAREGRKEQDQIKGAIHNNKVFTTQRLSSLYYDLQNNLNMIERTKSAQDQFRPWLAFNKFQKPQKRYLNGNLPAMQANGRKLEFKSPFSFNLKSHEEPIRIPTTTTELNGKLSYLLIPKKDPKAYLRTKVVNRSKQPILGGDANIYLDGDLTSKTRISTTNENAYMVFDLGVDELVESKRIVKKESIKEGMIFKKHQVEISVDIEVVNNHSFPIDIELKDNYPKSPNQEIEVKLLTVAPNPISKKYGIIDWKAKVKANSKETFTFKYQVTHPENYIIKDYDL